MLKRSFGAIKPIAEQRYAPPIQLCAIIDKMMHMKLENRYSSMTEVLRDLEVYERGRTGVGTVTPAMLLSADDQLFAEAFGRSRGGTAEPATAAATLKTVLCVEAQAGIQEAFKKKFTKLGYRVMMVGDAERAAERYREAPSDVVVFDADGLGEDGFESFLAMHEKAHEDGHELAALVILGPRQRELVAELPLDDRLLVLNKPIKMKDVQDALEQLAPTGT
jgi:CheY-like chemotaxis protein